MSKVPPREIITLDYDENNDTDKTARKQFFTELENSLINSNVIEWYSGLDDIQIETNINSITINYNDGSELDDIEPEFFSKILPKIKNLYKLTFLTRFAGETTFEKINLSKLKNLKVLILPHGDGINRNDIIKKKIQFLVPCGDCEGYNQMYNDVKYESFEECACEEEESESD